MSLASELIYVRWPHADGEPSKPRPALVVEGPDAQGDLLLMKGTGQSRYPGAMTIHAEDLASGALRKPSYVRLDRPLTLNETQVELRGVRLKDSTLAEVHLASWLCSRLRSMLNFSSAIVQGYQPRRCP